MTQKPSDNILLKADRCWIIRCQRPKRKDVFHVVGNSWNRSPLSATIYRKEEDAMVFIASNRRRGRKRGLFKDEDIVEAVPLDGAIKTCNLKPIQLTRE